MIKLGKIFFIAIILMTVTAGKTFAWGKTGHEIVAELAFHLLDEPTQKIIKDFLGNTTIEEAATWMDDSKGNSYFDYMRTWHYLDMNKGQSYQPSEERNILTVLHSAIVELRQYKTMKKKDVKNRIMLIFHLVGDLHQPLHTGYAVDKGGNTIEISSPVVSGNLHSIWDGAIIDAKNITLNSCIDYYNSMDSTSIAQAKKINELSWMKQSRSYLDSVYNFQNNYIDQKYVDAAGIIVKKQLVLAGIRLASILTEIFKPMIN